jgi:hypothetical protein
MIIKSTEQKITDPLEAALQNTLPLFAQKTNINHFSPTQFVIPDAAWLFKYVFMDQKMRRELLPSNAAMEAGKIVGEVLQRIYADTIYKLHPVKKKVAATTNEKITKDAALQEEIEKLKEYVPNDEKDSDKKQKYLEEIPEVINQALLGLKELAVASPVTCERQISIDRLEGFSAPLLPTVGRIDFDYGVTSSINNHEFGTPLPETNPTSQDAFPHKIIELKTKWSRLGKVKKDGSRSFLVSSVPATASFNHCVQVATYAAHFNFKVPAYLLYATKDGYVIFDSTNCPHLTVDGMKKNLQIMFNTFRRRERILAMFEHLTREEIIDEAAGMMDMNLDHPFAWNGMPAELLKEAKLLWKLS